MFVYGLWINTSVATYAHANTHTIWAEHIFQFSTIHANNIASKCHIQSTHLLKRTHTRMFTVECRVGWRIKIEWKRSSHNEKVKKLRPIFKYIVHSGLTTVCMCLCDEVKMNVCSYVMVYSCGASKTHCVYCYLVCWLCICSLLHQSEYYLHLLSFTHSFIHSFFYTLTKLLSFSFVCFKIVLFYKKYCSGVCLKQ